MELYLGILIFSLVLTGMAAVPFIDFLYRIKLHYRTPAPYTHKAGTPTGGGFLVIVMVTLLYAVIYPLVSKLGVYISASYPIKEELNILFFTFISFGLLGFYEDIAKLFRLKYSPLSKHVLHLILAAIISTVLFQNLSIQHFYFPIFGLLKLGFLYIPIATLTIYFMTRGFDITDGLDGLATGTLIIALLALWAISLSQLDTPLSIFISLWIGSLIALLYFNVYPARIWMGNVGSLAFGATLAVIGLMLGKTAALFIIGGIFLIEGCVNMFQYLIQTILRRPVFEINPLHYWLQKKGWPEPKIVLRFWLVAVVLSLLGLLLSYY